MRAVPVAVALTLTLFVAGTARAGGPTDYLAPPSACAGAMIVGSGTTEERRALVCLINWARRRARLRPVAQHRALRMSAVIKAQAIVSCGDFSHAPCGRTATAAAAAAGYRYSFWAENLYWGSQSLGTPYAFNPPNGYVLFLEDVSERPYRLDRMLTQLRLSGVLRDARAVVFGELPKCDEPDGNVTARDTVANVLGDFPGPVLFGFPSGHTSHPAMTLPLGVRTRVVADAEPCLVIEEAGVA